MKVCTSCQTSLVIVLRKLPLMLRRFKNAAAYPSTDELLAAAAKSMCHRSIHLTYSSQEHVPGQFILPIAAKSM